MSKIQNPKLAISVQNPNSKIGQQCSISVCNFGFCRGGRGGITLVSYWHLGTFPFVFIIITFLFKEGGQGPPPLPPRYLTLKDIPTRNYRLFFLVRFIGEGWKFSVWGKGKALIDCNLGFVRGCLSFYRKKRQSLVAVTWFSGGNGGGSVVANRV